MAIETNKLVMRRFTEFINTASEKLAAELISANAILRRIFSSGLTIARSTEWNEFGDD
jgi:hypothetical protein